MKKLTYMMTTIILVFIIVLPVTAQVSPKTETETRTRPGFPEARRMMQGDPGQMQRMMSESFKELLELNDEEWTVIRPKIVKVLTLSLQSSGNPLSMLMVRPGAQGLSNMRRRFPANSQSNTMEESMQRLKKLLENKDTTTAQIRDQVIKVRKEREKKQQELMTAKKDLRELLTVRQEAILISMGLLD